MSKRPLWCEMEGAGVGLVPALFLMAGFLSVSVCLCAWKTKHKPVGLSPHDVGMLCAAGCSALHPLLPR